MGGSFAMEIKFRNHNKQECYACKIKDVKQVFSIENDLYISFGYLHRGYRPDNKFIKHPSIEGLIISSMQYNRRLGIIDIKPYLQFYVIKDCRYNDKYKEIFLKSILPKMNEWYHKTLSMPDTEIHGVEVLLVEWIGNGFKLYDCRFA